VSISPGWLGSVLGLAMGAVVVICAVQLGLRRDGAGTAARAAHVAHLVMAVSMAGMAIPALAIGPSWAWQVAFGLLLAWFVVRSIAALRRHGAHLPHEAVHAVMALSMLLMVGEPMVASPTSMGAMHPPVVGGFGIVLAAILVGSAAFTMATPRPGSVEAAEGRLERGVHVTMCVAMAYMLVLMR
jgi:hypothetical protein